MEVNNKTANAVALMNENLERLIEKYDNSFTKLAASGEDIKQDLQTILDNGKVGEADNALKLEGKTLQDLNLTHGNKLIQAKAFFNNTRYSGVSGSAGEKLYFGEFTKLRDDSTLFFHLTCSYGATVDSDYVSVYLKFADKQTEQGYTYVDNENLEGMSMLAMNTFLRDIPAGTDKVTYGYPRNIGAGIGSVLNPNSNDDGRLAQTASVCIVYEVMED